MPDQEHIANARENIRFVLDDQVITLADVDPTRTVLQYLREDLGRIGTKEGCAEGDCGACTVVVAELDAEQRIRIRAINSCIQFLPTLDGKQLFTVESLSRNGNLHPVQQAMVDCHGSQCGFCTPGFVMSLFALYKTNPSPGRHDIDDALAGNLCRCTGYRPIVDAAKKMYELGRGAANGEWINTPSGSGDGDAEVMARELQTIRPDRTVVLGQGERRYFAPASLTELESVVHDHPEGHILAGGTDVGLWVTKQHRDLDTVIYLGQVAELKSIAVRDGHLEIGAGATLSDAVPAILEIYPELRDLFLRFASPPIRNAGTLGGNIANGSPIGDSMPALMTLGATLLLNAKGAVREVAMDDFYIDYQKNDRRPGEFLQGIRIPVRGPGQAMRSYKISKRFDQDISAVCAAFRMRLEGDTVAAIDVAYGGVAAIPKRATHCEQALHGEQWTESRVRSAMTALDQDFQPITDMRAGNVYRQQVAKNLLYKFFLETTGPEPVIDVYNHGR